MDEQKNHDEHPDDAQPDEGVADNDEGKHVSVADDDRARGAVVHFDGPPEHSEPKITGEELLKQDGFGTQTLPYSPRVPRHLGEITEYSLAEGVRPLMSALHPDHEAMLHEGEKPQYVAYGEHGTGAGSQSAQFAHLPPVAGPPGSGHPGREGTGMGALHWESADPNALHGSEVVAVVPNYDFRFDEHAEPPIEPAASIMTGGNEYDDDGIIKLNDNVMTGQEPGSRNKEATARTEDGDPKESPIEKRARTRANLAGADLVREPVIREHEWEHAESAKHAAVGAALSEDVAKDEARKDEARDAARKDDDGDAGKKDVKDAGTDAARKDDAKEVDAKSLMSKEPSAIVQNGPAKPANPLLAQTGPAAQVTPPAAQVTPPVAPPAAPKAPDKGK